MSFHNQNTCIQLNQYMWNSATDVRRAVVPEMTDHELRNIFRTSSEHQPARASSPGSTSNDSCVTREVDMSPVLCAKTGNVPKRLDSQNSHSHSAVGMSQSATTHYPLLHSSQNQIVTNQPFCNTNLRPIHQPFFTQSSVNYVRSAESPPLASSDSHSQTSPKTSAHSHMRAATAAHKNQPLLSVGSREVFASNVFGFEHQAPETHLSLYNPQSNQQLSHYNGFPNSLQPPKDATEHHTKTMQAMFESMYNAQSVAHILHTTPQVHSSYFGNGSMMTPPPSYPYYHPVVASSTQDKQKHVSSPSSLGSTTTVADLSAPHDAFQHQQINHNGQLPWSEEQVLHFNQRSQFGAYLGHSAIASSSAPTQDPLVTHVCWQQKLCVYIERLSQTNLFCSLSQEPRYMLLCRRTRSGGSIAIENPPLNLHTMMQRLSVSAIQNSKDAHVQAQMRALEQDMLKPYDHPIDFEEDFHTLCENIIRCYTHDTTIVSKLTRFKLDVLDQIDDLKVENMRTSEMLESPVFVDESGILCPEWSLLDEDPCDAYFQWDEEDSLADEKVVGGKRRSNVGWSDLEIIRAHRKKEKLEHFHRTGSTVPIKKHSYHMREPAPGSDPRGNYEEMKRRVMSHYFEVQTEEPVVKDEQSQQSAAATLTTSRSDTVAPQDSQNSSDEMEDESVVDEKDNTTKEDVEPPLADMQSEKPTYRKRKRTSPKPSSETNTGARSVPDSTVDTSPQTPHHKSTKRPRKKRKLTPSTKSTTPTTFLQATIAVLKEKNRALTPNEIADVILSRKMVQTRGKTPTQTIAARCYSYIKENHGKRCEIQLAGPGKFAYCERSKK